ncbi:hypothetical protein PFISCL1PPCAC_13806, partial [Pristionchus fissidentatus]
LLSSHSPSFIMSNIELSLDDIIARNQANKRGAMIGKNRGGNPGNRGAFKSRPNSSPATHPRFNPIVKEMNAHKSVRINISQLAPTVRTADLQELFANYGVQSASVNYGEVGQPLGTADIVLTKRDAHRVLNDFHGVSIDG